MNKPQSRGRLAVVLVVALLTMLVYTAGYFGLQIEPVEAASDGCTDRTFSADWQCSLFVPAARVETALTGRRVRMLFRDGGTETMTSYTVHDADNQPEGCAP